jgi:hypothetical protein
MSWGLVHVLVAEMHEALTGALTTEQIHLKELLAAVCSHADDLLKRHKQIGDDETGLLLPPSGYLADSVAKVSTDLGNLSKSFRDLSLKLTTQNETDHREHGVRLILRKLAYEPPKDASFESTAPGKKRLKMLGAMIIIAIPTNDRDPAHVSAEEFCRKCSVSELKFRVATEASACDLFADDGRLIGSTQRPTGGGASDAQAPAPDIQMKREDVAISTLSKLTGFPVATDDYLGRQGDAGWVHGGTHQIGIIADVLDGSANASRNSFGIAFAAATTDGLNAVLSCPRRHLVLTSHLSKPVEYKCGEESKEWLAAFRKAIRCNDRAIVDPPRPPESLKTAWCSVPGDFKDPSSSEKVRGLITNVAAKCQYLRITGAAAFDLASLALGELDVRLSFSVDDADMFAATMFVRALGGVVLRFTDAEGKLLSAPVPWTPLGTSQESAGKKFVNRPRKGSLIAARSEKLALEAFRELIVPVYKA